jgi:probable rRNA maturation factor
MSGEAGRNSLPAIEVRNAQRRIRFDLAALNSFARRAVVACAAGDLPTSVVLSRFAEVLVVVISDRRMSDLHWRFMKVRGPTDVITFDHGEIFISVETARKNARRFGTSTMEEIQLYIVHGLLHLSGFDDRTPQGARVMATKQERILERIRKKSERAAG